MFDGNEIAERALLRAGVIKARRRRGRKRLLRAAAFACGVGVLWLAARPGAPTGTHSQSRATAMLFDGASEGSYVLVGVLCFLLGVATALFFAKSGRRRTDNSK